MQCSTEMAGPFSFFLLPKLERCQSDVSNKSQQVLGNRYAISGLCFEWTNGGSANVFLVGSWSFGLRTLGRCNEWPREVST